jgi:hypothetical protein
MAFPGKRQKQEQPPQEADNGSQGNGKKSPPWYTRRYRVPAGGAIELAIFQREEQGENNSTFTVFSTSIKKSYHNGKEWVTLNSFRPEELPILALAAQHAAEVITSEYNRK